MKRKYISQKSEKFKQESGHITLFALRPRQKFMFHLFLCLEAYCSKMTQNEVTVLCCEGVITLTYLPFPYVSTAMGAHLVNLEYFLFIQSETRILGSAFKTQNISDTRQQPEVFYF
jgi:uncharacterized circularly permuted ATP-grasp superfamily protein